MIMSDHHQKKTEKVPVETLDCSGAGMCQPEPDEETDGFEKQELVSNMLHQEKKVQQKEK